MSKLTAKRRLRRLAGRVKRRLSRSLPVVGPPTAPLYEAWVAAVPPHAVTTSGAPVSGMARLSILMAVHDPPSQFLRQAIASIQGQTSGDWELVLSDDGSIDPLVQQILEQAAALPGTRLVRSPTATGIVGALNRAIEQSAAAFLGVLDHDDLLHPRAVEVLLAHLDAHPELDVAYSDEDKVDEAGRHFDPYFKPDHSPELLLGSMYLNHFTAMRSDLVRRVGGFRVGTDGAQDHDLAFRLIRAGAVVGHVPGVLYHWRAWSGSTASGIQAKPWAQAAASRVQVDHLAAIGFPGTAEPSSIPGLNEVHPTVVGTPRITAVIPTISRRAATAVRPYVNDCVASLLRAGGYPTLDIVVVHTNEPSREQRRALDAAGAELVVYPTDDFNFSTAINLGAAAASGEYLLILNDDTTVHRPGSVRHMVEFAQLPGVGAVGARLSYPDGRTQHAGILLADGLPTHPHHGAAARDGGYFGSVIAPHNCLAVTGAALMTRRDTFESVGGLDERWPHDYQDVDYCLRLIEAGLRVAYVPYAHFTHLEGASLEREAADPQATTLFRSRWGHRYAADPYYSVLLDSRLAHLHRPL